MSCVHLSFLSIRLPPQGELVDADKARDDSPKARSSRSSVQWVRWVIDGCSVAGLGLEWARPVGMEEAHHHIRMKPTTRSTAERRSVLWSIMNHCLLPDLGAR
jgi:hypothetical protein